MKNKILSVMLVMILLIGTCGVAVAADMEGTATRNYLKSYGSIEYHNGEDKVIINSDDLYMLADQIDQIKLNVTNQLEGINTYFTAGDGISLSTDDDISISHSQPSEDDTVDPLSVNFDTMMEGIAASQSISTDVSDYGYPSGTKLYSVNGSMTTDGSDKDAKEVLISSASAENMSAGAAAWVNGELIIGNGANNNAYYEQGVLDGQADVIENPKEYGVNLNVLYFATSNGNTKTYTIPKDGTYTFIVKTTWNNNQMHNAVGNKVTLNIGSETITVFNHYWSNESWNWVFTGSTNKTITRKCSAGTKITITTSKSESGNGDYAVNAYTSASLLIY